MAIYNLSKSFTWQGKITDKVASVCRMFGLTVERLKQPKTYTCEIDIRTGDIVYITGPSGSGKSVLMSELEKAVPAQERISLAQIPLPENKTVIDCISAGTLLDSLRLLGIAGLNDVFCILNQPGNLSESEKYRFRLAIALASKKKFVFADEFCSELDRISAASVSFRLRRFIDKTKVTFILASSHEDILLDLSPDVLVTRDLSGSTTVVYKDTGRVCNAHRY